MKAVNLVPEEVRRGRVARSSNRPAISVGSAGPATFVVVLLLIVVLIVLIRVLTDNDVNNKKATLVAISRQVSTEKAEAAKLSVYTQFVQAAQQRESDVRAIAELRFPWAQTFTEISHVLPVSTSLKSLSGTITPTATTNSTGATVSGPTFMLSGCASTHNQNGTATLLRRLNALSGVINVGFQSSTRTALCGNSFSVTLTFQTPGTTSSGATTTASSTTTGTSTTTAASTGTTTTG